MIIIINYVKVFLAPFIIIRYVDIKNNLTRFSRGFYRNSKQRVTFNCLNPIAICPIFFDVLNRIQDYKFVRIEYF